MKKKKRDKRSSPKFLRTLEAHFGRSSGGCLGVGPKVDMSMFNVILSTILFRNQARRGSDR